MNIIQVQNHLKDLSDQQLAGQMQSGEVPAYLVVAEFDRRRRVRNSAVPAEMPTSTVADDALMGGVAALPVAEAPAFASGGIVSFRDGGEPRTMRYKGQDYPVNELGQVLYNGEWVRPSTLGLRSLAAPVAEHFGKVSDAWEDASFVGGLNAVTENYGQSMKGNVPQWQRRLRSQEARQNEMDTSLVDQIPTGPAPSVGGAQQVPPPSVGGTQQVPPPNAIAAGVEDVGIAGALGSQAAPAGGAPATPKSAGIMGLTERYMNAEPPAVSTDATDKAAQEMRDSLKGREKDNLNMALMQAGFAMMSGTSPYAFENMGKGAMAGLQAYTEGKKDIDDLRKEISALEISAEKARNEGNMEKYRADLRKMELLIGLENSALDRASRESIAANNLAVTRESTRDTKLLTQIRGYEKLSQDYQLKMANLMDPADKDAAQQELSRINGVLERLYAQLGGMTGVDYGASRPAPKASSRYDPSSRSVVPIQQ